MSWSTRRRLIYGAVIILFLALVTGAIFWNTFYESPTCSDGYQNGEETGVDCGGGCKNLCTSDALSPIVFWTKVFNISGDVYSLVSYAENPNINSLNRTASYEFKVYDENNKLILTKEGTTFIPKGKKFSVFENGIVIKNSKPKIAEIKFTSFGPWEKKPEVEPNLGLKYSTLSATSSLPKVTGTITNDSLENIKEVELSVFVLDGNENVVAASKTFVDRLLNRTSQDFVFTWPKSFDLGVEACTAPLDVVLALDRSGSMRSEGISPPEPFTTVTKTAKNFVKNLKEGDQVSVLSFGNNSRLESGLSVDKDRAISAIDRLFLSTTTLEQTNITGGLTDALNELASARSGSKRAIVLLTDGIPTLPVDVNTPDFPVYSAQQVSKNIVGSNIELFTIGLGKTVSEGFLKSISSDDNHYFLAPTKETLADIYSKIATSLCQRKPNVVNVIYKILD